MRVLFVAGFSPIVRDPAASQAFYRDTLGPSLEGAEGDYAFTEPIGSVKHLGLWPRPPRPASAPAEWPGDIPALQATVAFELESPAAVQAADDELLAGGHRLIHPARTEPWTQTIARLLSPGGVLIGVCYTPLLHEGYDHKN